MIGSTQIPCCSIPIFPRILSFDRDLVPPKFDMLWINWTLFPRPRKQKHHIYPLWYFYPVPGGKVAIQILVKIIEGLIPIIIWRKFYKILLPASGWHILILKIDELKIEVEFFDPSCAVSHWIDSVSCCCRRHHSRYLFYISICRILWRSGTGRGAFILEAWCNQEQEFYHELLLDFCQKILITLWIFGKGF